MNEKEFIKNIFKENIQSILNKFPKSLYADIVKNMQKDVIQKINYQKKKHELELLENYKIPPKYISEYRIVGINEHYFYINCDERPSRVNTHYYSKDFPEVLKKYKETNINLTIYDIRKIFIKEKDNLKHLSWKVIGYF